MNSPRSGLQALLWPESLAVVGASTNQQSPAGRLLEVLQQHEFGGRVYAVNPRRPTLSGGLTAYADLRSLPECPDLCLLVVSAERVPDALEECRAIGAKSVLVYSSSPPAEYQYLRKEIERVTGEEGGPLVMGPNSVGLLNTAAHLAATWSPVIDESRAGQHMADGPVAIIAQSGGLGFGLAGEAARRGLGVRYVLSTGNEADLDAVEAAEFLISDSTIKVLMLFLEGIRRPLDILRLVARARQAGQRLVVAKVGRSEAARSATELHTAHLAGSDAAYEAVFQHCGINRAVDTEQMVDVAMALARCPDLAGPGIGIVTASGGSAVWVADAVESSGLSVPVLSASEQGELREMVGTYGSVRNPVDLTGPRLVPTALGDAAAYMAALPQVDAVVVILPMLGSRDSNSLTSRLAEVQSRTGKPVIMYTYAGASAQWVTELSDQGLAWFSSPGRVAAALFALSTRAGHPAGAPRAEMARAGGLARLATDPERVLNEHSTKEMLKAAGIPTTTEVLARSREEAEKAAAEIGERVAMKAQSVRAVHKVALGLVRLDVEPAAVGDAFDHLWRRCTEAVGAEPDGVLLQQMVPIGQEMIVGITRDDDFGPLLMVGIGGSTAEVINDRVLRMAPVTLEEAYRMIGELRSIGHLREAGAIGEEGIQALAALVAQVSELAWDRTDHLTGLDLNPVTVHGGEAIVVDANAVVRLAT